MNTSGNNPSQNKLINGITDSDIENAILKSGYPLQTIITNKLREKFSCQEEWSYIDGKTKENRSLDIMAELHLYEVEKKQKRVRPTLNLLIECKQSEMPHVFFLSPNKMRSENYPFICGLFDRYLKISSNDTVATYTTSIIRSLDLFNDPFLIDSVPCSMTFSKCARSGKDIVLSGTDAYHNLVLPLVKSLQYFEIAETPPKTAKYFDAHMPFAIGIIDGPMVGVTIDEESHKTELIPWVRVYRHESYEHESWSERKKLFAIDIVHKDFFDTFLNSHLIPFAKRYADLMLKHHNEIADGKGFIKGMDKDSYRNLEPRLEQALVRKRIFT